MGCFQDRVILLAVVVIVVVILLPDFTQLITSNGNTTANIYVKNCSVYIQCKGDIVVVDIKQHKSQFTKFKHHHYTMLTV